MRLAPNTQLVLLSLSALISAPPVLFDPPPFKYTLEAVLQRPPNPYTILWLLFVAPVCWAAALLFLESPSTGERPAIEDTLFEALRRYPKLVAGFLLFTVALIVGFVLFVLPGLYLMVLMPIYFCHLVICDAPLLASLKEARKMLRGKLGRVLLVEAALLLALIFFSAVTLILHRLVAPLGAYELLVLLHALSGTLTTALSLWAAIYLYERVRPAREAPPPLPASEALWL